MLAEVKATPAADAVAMLQQAEWAAAAFAKYDAERVNRIVRAVAEAGHANAHRFAEMAVAETGFGVVEDKALKNEEMSLALASRYDAHAYCSHRVLPEQKMLEIPRPAGVILALLPSTSPVSALYFKAILALVTRNAVVISPHPAAAGTCLEAGELLAEAAKSAGAPDGALQVLAKPTVDLVHTMMRDPRTRLILATGGSAMVRAAYESGTPALGVGPGNPPVLVDDSADLDQAAADIVRSKAFDNSVLCTAESVLIAVESISRGLLDRMRRHGAHVCSPEEVGLLRDLLFPEGKFNTEAVGRSAGDLAGRAGVRVAPNTKVLLAPIERVVDEEPLTHEKLSPVLAIRTVPDAHRGIAEAKAVLRVVGRGHSAVIHSRDAATILEFGAELHAHRITVNAPGSQGSAGMGTHLAPSMSVGTGFVGGSAIGENLRPDHLIQWTRVAFSADPAIPFPEFGGLTTPQALHDGGRVPPYPEASSQTAAPAGPRAAAPPREQPALTREQLRRIVLEELAELMETR